GLFADELKRPIPILPRRVGVVTSKTGAAFHDIVHMLTRRAPSVSIVLAHSLVQGEGSADSVRRALLALNQYNDGLPPADKIDVIIVGRGGGSAEDLWAFNDEALARAIRMSAIPVISAVGHEIDWTISDMVADLRAATPSAAAEIVAAREEDVFHTFRSGEERLVSLITRLLDEAEARTVTAMDDLRGNFDWTVQYWQDRYSGVTSRLRAETLIARSAAAAATISMLEQRRDSAFHKGITSRTEGLNVQMAKLNALSPLAVLTRGYSITQTVEGDVVRDAESVTKGDKLIIRVERGKLNAEVLSSE
ncbi:MAG: exodeoxyribonuclease VII large subunit, partial [Pyrinomonadaceae bacterium]